jgi:hypothetical protein
MEIDQTPSLIALQIFGLSFLINHDKPKSSSHASKGQKPQIKKAKLNPKIKSSSDVSSPKPNPSKETPTTEKLKHREFTILSK